MDFFSTQNIMLNIPPGAGGYPVSWIEAIGTLAGLICIWLASYEKLINYLFGIINVVLFAVIFFQIQLYASLLLQLFFFGANVYGWYAWSRQSQQQALLKIRWLSRPAAMIWGGGSILAIALVATGIDPLFAWLSRATLAILHAFGINVAAPVLAPDAFPFWDACMMVLSIVAMILMTRKYVENWLLWAVVNVISIGIFALQGVWVMALEYLILLFIALNGCRVWIKSAREHSSRALNH
ncbi:nicotinamide riboside transporter PnuC [Erwinia sp. HR93]|uniref:nicotinamide riboside transporter PnuC n=1 Tax=Erwinia sp. HR93 TaxID=3094840 RepID=UPI002ADECFCF|nr:nicotinamide riboside transporter PnuC [Erwinia sp. HR93]MEA1064466.1 nicotinamide riboside transporter PnuC [Erwinia sp. HR93]